MSNWPNCSYILHESECDMAKEWISLIITTLIQHNNQFSELIIVFITRCFL